MAEDKHRRIVDFVCQRIVGAAEATPIFLGETATPKVGLLTPDGITTWFEDAESFGVALADDAGFQAMRLGTWLGTADGFLVAEAVSAVLPPSYRPEYQLVVDGLKIAASHQREAGWQKATGVAVLTVVLGLSIWISRTD
jgi:hypothetical protein